MAVIKDGNGGTDQLSIDPISKAARVLLYDASGNVLLGQKAMVGSVPVAIASDQPALPVNQYRPFKNTSWAVQNTNSASKATASQAAAGAGVKNVCTGFMISVSTLGTAPTATTLTFNLIDGASGGGAILWSFQVRVPATVNTNQPPIMLAGMWLEGSLNTAMTLESSAAPGTNIQATCAMMGTTI